MQYPQKYTVINAVIRRCLGELVAKANNISAVPAVPLRRQLPRDLHRFLALPLPKDCSSKQPRIPAASVSQTHLLLQVIQYFFKPSPYRKYPVYPWPHSSIVCNNTFAPICLVPGVFCPVPTDHKTFHTLGPAKAQRNEVLWSRGTVLINPKKKKKKKSETFL